MALDLLARHKKGPDDTLDERVWNALVEDLAVALNSLTGKADSFDQAKAELIQAALFRLNEILLPAYERVFEYQQGGFLTAPIADASAVDFVEGFTALAIHPDKKDLFRPTPYVALTRASTSADVAIARADGYDPVTGGLQLEIVAVLGEGGSFTDVIVSATAGSVQAQQAFLADARAARDKAADWADKAVDAAVESGRFSAKHHATKAAASGSAASGSASTASTKAGEATTAATTAGAARDKAQQWADEAEDVAVETGKFSGRHWALKAAASAAAAATFDPSSFYTKVEVYAKAETYSQSEVDAAIAAAINELVGDAPGALDTLNELAAAINDDASFAASVTTSLAGKAPTVHAHTAAQISDATVDGRSLMTAANFAAMRTLLGLVIGTNVQAYDADTAKTDVAQTWTAAQQFGQIRTGITAVGGGTQFDCSGSVAFSRNAIAGNITFSTTGVPAGSYGFTVLLPYTSGTITWFSGVQWPDGVAPSFTGGKTYLVMFHTMNGGTTWRGAVIQYDG